MPGFLSVEQYNRIVSKVHSFAGKQFDHDVDTTSNDLERVGLAGGIGAGAKGPPAGGPCSRSVLARQQDRLVGEIQRDLGQRKIRVLDRLAKDGLAVPVLAGERRRVVVLQLPQLELLAGNALGAPLSRSPRRRPR